MSPGAVSFCEGRVNTRGVTWLVGGDRSRRRPSLHATVAALVLTLLATACGSSGGGGSGGTPTLKFYVFKEPGGAFAQAAQACTQQSGGRYRVVLADLPPSADQQREQLVRRLAAHDKDIDIMGMDVIWTAEFAEAGWLVPWDGDAAAKATEGTIAATVQTGTYKDRLYAAPFTTNTQLLWYRKDRVPTPPTTWAEMVDMAEQIGDGGRIQVQGNRYEGLTVWFNSLLASARGSVLKGPDQVDLATEPTTRALEVMKRVATSRAADPTLSTSQEDQARLAFESGSSSFMVNYSFVWPSAQKNAPELAKNMGWAPWPRVLPDEPAHVTLGGINLGVAAYSRHPQLALDAAACLRSAPNQIVASEKGGLPPTTEALYDEPRVREAFPFADVMREMITQGSARPISPAYNDVSLAIQRGLHPPRGIDPVKDVKPLRDSIQRSLKSGGLL
ncbi:MAG: trehalose/maltose transport system substrate-binding protein [Actinomycetota bacterium]|nr:trehalose/maltose transport system substrate-binding protein [Actinomycetota bacterium]